MVQYKQRLKAKVQNIIILMEDPNNIKKLIKQAIKVDNRIYQNKRVRRELNRLL